MADMTFDEEQSRELATRFIERLLIECRDRFSSIGLENLSKSVCCFLGDPAYPEVWRETYENTFGMHFSKETRLNGEEVFTNLIDFSLRFVYEWGIDISEASRLLFLICFKPNEYQKERGIWQEEASNLLRKKTSISCSSPFFRLREVKRACTSEMKFDEI